jgi:hypothetical protein
MAVGRFEQSGITRGIYTQARDMSNLDFIRRMCSSSRTDRVLPAPNKGHGRGGSGDIFQWILCLPYAATAMRKNFLHIAGHRLYNAMVGGFYRGVRSGEGSAGGILFFESKGIQSFF